MGLTPLSEKDTPDAVDSGVLFLPGLFVSLALLELAPLVQWANESPIAKAFGGLFGSSLRTTFDTSGQTGWWLQGLSALVWGSALVVALALGRRIAATGAILGMTSDKNAERVFGCVLAHFYVIAIPILALTHSHWREPLMAAVQSALPAEGAKSNVATMYLRCALAALTASRFLLTTSAVASLIAFISFGAWVEKIRQLPKEAFRIVDGVAAGIPGGLYAWAFFGGLPGALLARSVFGPHMEGKVKGSFAPVVIVGSLILLIPFLIALASS